MKTINIAKDFSPFPGGRYKTDGKFSGEGFREEFLEPNIKNNESITILLDGTRGYGSSFLEEAFGGLVRAGFDKNQILTKLTLKSTNISLLKEIREYIDSAEKND